MGLKHVCGFECDLCSQYAQHNFFYILFTNQLDYLFCLHYYSESIMFWKLQAESEYFAVCPRLASAIKAPTGLSHLLLPLTKTTCGTNAKYCQNLGYLMFLFMLRRCSLLCFMIIAMHWKSMTGNYARKKVYLMILESSFTLLEMLAVKISILVLALALG